MESSGFTDVFMEYRKRILVENVINFGCELYVGQIYIYKVPVGRPLINHLVNHARPNGLKLILDFIVKSYQACVLYLVYRGQRKKAALISSGLGK